MSLALELTEVNMWKAYRMSLMLSFIQKLTRLIKRIDRDELWSCLSFIVMREGEAIHGAKLISVGKDRMVEIRVPNGRPRTSSD